MGVTGRIDVTLDETVQPDFDDCHPLRIENSDGSSIDPLCSRQDYTPEQNCGRGSGQGSVGKPAVSGLGCPQCGQSALHGKQTAGLCRLCRQRRGQLRPASAKVTRQLPQCPSEASQVPRQMVSCLGSAQDKRHRAQRPASAQEKQKHLPSLDSNAQLSMPPRAVPAVQRPSSAQGQRPSTAGSASSAQKQRRRTLGPAVIQEHLTSVVGPSSTPGQIRRTVGYAPGQELSVRDQRRNSLGPAPTSGLLHQPLITGLAQDPLEQQRPRQRTQRPASAQENRRFAKRSRAEEEFILQSTPGSARRGENTGVLPMRLSQRPSTLTPPPKAAPTKTKSQDDLLTKVGAATNRTSPSETRVHQRMSSRSTISSPGDRQLIRELFRMKKLDGARSYDIPELAELSSEDPLPSTSAQESSQTRPRKDVGRSQSFTKIPKPVAMN